MRDGLVGIGNGGQISWVGGGGTKGHTIFFCGQGQRWIATAQKTGKSHVEDVKY